MKEIDKEIRALLMSIIISKREKATKAGKANNTSNDLFGILLRSNFKEIREQGNNKNMGLSLRDVVEECKLFYFAGQETTSVLLVWTMVLLGKHPVWQDRAKAEVLQAFGTNKPDFDGLSHLKVVTMILHEVLRLYPAIAIIDRKVQDETRLGNFTWPAGVLVGLPS